jgi:hypothetical protein
VNSNIKILVSYEERLEISCFFNYIHKYGFKILKINDYQEIFYQKEELLDKEIFLFFLEKS